MTVRLWPLVAGLLLGCRSSTPGVHDSAFVASRTRCIAIGADTSAVATDSFDLHSHHRERTAVVVFTSHEHDLRFTMWYQRGLETGTRYVAFAHDTLVCAEERPATYTGTGDITPMAVVFAGGRPYWFYSLTKGDSLLGKADSLPEVSKRLRAEADSARASFDKRTVRTPADEKS